MVVFIFITVQINIRKIGIYVSSKFRVLDNLIFFSFFLMFHIPIDQEMFKFATGATLLVPLFIIICLQTT